MSFDQTVTASICVHVVAIKSKQQYIAATRPKNQVCRRRTAKETMEIAKRSREIVKPQIIHSQTIIVVYLPQSCKCIARKGTSNPSLGSLKFIGNINAFKHMPPTSRAFCTFKTGVKQFKFVRRTNLCKFANEYE